MSTRETINLDDLSKKDVLVAAKVGINALIDEATGYQDVRPKDDLAKMRDKYKKEN